MERTPYFQKFPESLRKQIAVGSFSNRIACQRPLLETLFDFVTSARGKYEKAQEPMQPLINAIGESKEKFSAEFDKAETRRNMWELAAYSALYGDAGSALILIASSSLERLHESTGISLLDRGVYCYVPTIRFSAAITMLANQYKHLGEKIHRKNQRDHALIAQLVDDPLGEHTASEFLKRSNFTAYEQFQNALLSCCEGLADGITPTPAITIRHLWPGKS